MSREGKIIFKKLSSVCPTATEFLVNHLCSPSAQKSYFKKTSFLWSPQWIVGSGERSTIPGSIPRSYDSPRAIRISLGTKPPKHTEPGALSISQTVGLAPRDPLHTTTIRNYGRPNASSAAASPPTRCPSRKSRHEERQCANPQWIPAHTSCSRRSSFRTSSRIQEEEPTDRRVSVLNSNQLQFPSSTKC